MSAAHSTPGGFAGRSAPDQMSAFTPSNLFTADVSRRDATRYSRHPGAMDLWRPQGDRLTYSDAGWSGAVMGIAMHATLNFFSVAIPSLERLLVVFSPAQRFAFALTTHAPPLGRFFFLLLTLGAFWAVGGMLLLIVVRGVVSVSRRMFA